MLRDVRSHMDEDEFFDARCFGHAAGAGGAALTVCLAVFGHHFLIVPAHAEHHVGIAGQFRYGIAGLRVAGEYYRFAAFGVESVCEGVEVRLHVLSRSGGNLPLVCGFDRARADVAGVDERWFAGQGPASVDVDALAQRMTDSCDPIVREDALFFVENAVGDAFGERRAVDAESILFADRLVPTAKQEARVVDIVVEVVVSEEEIVDLSRPEAGLDEFVGCCRAAVEHDFFAVDVGNEGGSEAGRSRRGGAGT